MKEASEFEEMPDKLAEAKHAIIARLNFLLEESVGLASKSMTEPAAREIHDQITSTLDDADRLGLDGLSDCTSLDGTRKRLMTLNEELHHQTECRMVREYLNSSVRVDPFAGSYINKGFSALLAGQLHNWRKNGVFDKPLNRIAVVGSGALPQTQYFLQQHIGCHVEGIESDKEAAELSQALIHKLGVRNLSVAHADGALYDYADYDLIVIATMVRKKLEIASRILETSPSSMLAPRSPVGNHRLWRDAVDISKMNQIGWRLMDKLIPENSSVSSLLFKVA